MLKIISFYQAVKGFPFKKYLPLGFFVGGFVFDAATLGRQIQTNDLYMLSGYLLLAGGILWWLAHHARRASIDITQTRTLRLLPQKWRAAAPFFVLQFIFGNLLSALFIVYFKSASHLLAFVLALVLAGLLVGNEYLEEHYQEHTISWTMFGFCAILLLNFVLPSLLGSIHWFWFVLSTLIGAGLAHALYQKSAQPMRHIVPTWVLAGVLMLAYFCDVIPPVPLVKQDIAVGTALDKAGGRYTVQVDNPAWWQFWRLFSRQLHIKAGERVYFVSAVFAPQGLKTRLYHRWQYHTKNGWITASRIGFGLNGGRQGGFRGYTYKQNLSAGDWRVTIETENAQTLSTDSFSIVLENDAQPRKPEAI